MHAKSLQSCPTFCNPMDHSSPDSSAHGIFQARILKWVTMPSSRVFSRPRYRTHVSYISCRKEGPSPRAFGGDGSCHT